ncbi:lipopolysaccharide-induced tumor necrosis factor-alpha factor homolog isoform X2 [Cynoglossus semilaevis]|uniref:lipopolysaccharide-induced tumor necrosis factor-alpha factor homolog isoform X2 n=1 Tax=Cynoglossus semilaevis TaxID=244447 RepID=UPI000D62E3A4|nr:lipopolysaccharide-induced tumor necrosis factor-alpha factor homolog isoform X2 [Cynoglossus semilaevis]
MEKENLSHESVPPYPGPPLNYGSAAPPAVVYGVPSPGVPASTVTHVVVTPGLRDVPGQTVCPHCNQTVVTNTEFTSGLLTWLICGGMALVGCFLCCCIPFCLDSSVN